MVSSRWREMLLDPGEGRHLVLVHRTDDYLHTCVAAWAARPLTTGGGTLLVGREEYLGALVRQISALGVDAEARIAAGRLVLMEADETLESFLTGGEPDVARFRSAVQGALDKLRAACGSASADIRAWGEMVSLLHERGRVPQARKLESLWEDLLSHEKVRLLCTYKMAGVRDLADVAETHSTIVVESEDIEGTATRVLAELYGERAGARPLDHLVRRGALPIGGTPPRALLMPLEGWRRPAASV